VGAKDAVANVADHPRIIAVNRLIAFVCINRHIVGAGSFLIVGTGSTVLAPNFSHTASSDPPTDGQFSRAFETNSIFNVMSYSHPL
jgi:hypothetical protein